MPDTLNPHLDSCPDVKFTAAIDTDPQDFLQRSLVGALTGTIELPLRDLIDVPEIVVKVDEP